MIIATAGHIDHGKTALVKALTGIDTDRLPEEKKRGMSIDLGFAYHPLPSGQVLGFVDVPGHERFIRNMLAGVTGIDYAVLIVAADDGPMPQTEEHLSILDLLGVSDGLIALTKIDRVDDARLEDVKGEIEVLTAGTCLEGADIMPVSAIEGTGVDDLREHLETMTDLVGERQGEGHFRLAIDRCFTVQGAGLVVTGAVFSGKVAVGDHLTLSPEGVDVRVRGIHAQNKESEAGVAGQRCALNITGPDLKSSEVHRGGWLVANDIHAPVPRFDARLRVLKSETKPLRHWTPVHVHSGAAELPGRVAVLGENKIAPGESGLVQIVLDRRIGVLKNDGFILRDQSAQRTIAGGDVIDPFSPSRGRAKPERLAFLADLEKTSADDALTALLENNPAGIDLKSFMITWNLTDEDKEMVLELVDHVFAGPEAAPVIFSPTHWTSLQNETLANLQAWHESNPERASLNTHALRSFSNIRIPLPVYQDLLDRLAAEKKIMNLGAGYCYPGFEPTISKKDAALWNKIKPILIDGHMKPPVVAELADQLDAKPKDLNKYLVRIAKLGMVNQVAKNRFLLPEAVLELAYIAEKLGTDKGDDGFGAADFRDQTKVGRNLAIEILEFFDRSGLTWRSGDTRKLLKPVSEVFGEK